MDVYYFEIMRKKTHILCQVKDGSTVGELKKIVQGILKIAPEKQTLKKPNDQRSEWVSLEDKQTLAECGFTAKSAKADEPAVLALVLPEAMRHREQEFSEGT